MNKISAAQRIFLYIAISLFTLCAFVMSIAWTATATPALSLSPAPATMRSFAFAQIAKPAYTSTPVPTLTPTATVQQIQAEIIENTPAPQNAALEYNGNKYILVDISEQHMYVYEGDALVYSFIASTGMNNATSVGSFSVLNKIPNAYGETWDIWMPNWLGIYWAGSLQNGIHALPILSNGGILWAGYLGTPISYGCVVLDTYDAQVLYNWAEVGTRVDIQW